MMKSQLCLKMEMNGQLHALPIVYSGENPSTHWTENQVGPQAILLMAMMWKIWDWNTTLVVPKQLLLLSKWSGLQRCVFNMSTYGSSVIIMNHNT